MFAIVFGAKGDNACGLYRMFTQKREVYRSSLVVKTLARDSGRIKFDNKSYVLPSFTACAHQPLRI